MAQYVNGTSALMSSAMQYDPLSFKRMRIPAGKCLIRAFRDKRSNTLFELCCEGTPVMAFYFSQLRPWEEKQRRDAFRRLFSHESAGGTIITFDILPTQLVDTLPWYPMWKLSSSLGETLFWSDSSLVLAVCPAGTKVTSVQIFSADGILVATFKITGAESDDEYVLDRVISLRQDLGIERPVRIESWLGNQKIVWYHPALQSPRR